MRRIRTVEDLVEWYLASRVLCASRSPSAKHERDRVLGIFRRANRNKCVDRLNGDDLLRFLDARAPPSAWARRRWCLTIRRPFNCASRLGLVSKNPFAMVRLPAGNRGRDLTRDEWQALLRASTPQFRRVLIFLRLSGCRPEELRSLTWSKVRIEVRAVLLSVHKTSAVQRDKRPRRIALCTILLKLLAVLRRRQKCGDHVFLNSRGRPWTRGAICKYLREKRRRLGLPEDLKLYSNRHAFATGAILNGVDIATLAELLGHNSTRTTEIYLHLSGKADHLNAAVERAVAKLA